MAQSFSIDKLRGEISKRGVLKPSKFRVDFGMPPALNGTQSLINNELIKQAADGTISMWCESANIPGAQLTCYPVRRYGYGAVENKPFAPNFGDMDMMFRSDADGLVHGFLHAWMRIALNYDHSGTILRRGGVVSGQHTYELAYKTEYMQDITIRQFDDAGAPSLQIVLREAFPTYIGDVPLNWGAFNEYSRIPAKFTFIGWYNLDPGPSSAEQTAATTPPREIVR